MNESTRSKYNFCDNCKGYTGSPENSVLDIIGGLVRKLSINLVRDI